MEDLRNEILVSPASFWEIAIKASIGKLSLDLPYRDFIAGCLEPGMFRPLPIETTHLVQVAAMPFPTRHKDPFDRLLIAQAIVEGVPIVGADAAFDAYPVRRIW